MLRLDQIRALTHNTSTTPQAFDVLEDESILGGPAKFDEVIRDPEYAPTAYIHKRVPKKKRKDDPVTRGQRYREEQQRYAIPGQNRHTQLRWNVREQMRENAVSACACTCVLEFFAAFVGSCI